MNLKCVRAVFKIVGYARAVRRQLLGLANRNEARAQSVGHGGSKNETAGLNPQNHIDTQIPALILQAIDDASQALFVFEKRGDVIKENPGFGKIGDLTNELFEVIHALDNWGNRSLRAKGTQLLHGSFLRFNPAYFGHPRTLMEKGFQAIQLIGCSGSVDLNPSVVFVSCPATHADPECVLLDEVSEPDSLYASRDKPAARFGHRSFQSADPWGLVEAELFMTSSIASRKLLTVKGLAIR